MMTVNKEGEGSQARQQKQRINNPQEPYARRTGTAQAHGLISSARVPETPPILFSLRCTFLQTTDTLKWLVSCASYQYLYNTCRIRFTVQVRRGYMWCVTAHFNRQIKRWQLWSRQTRGYDQFLTCHSHHISISTICVTLHVNELTFMSGGCQESNLQ